MKTLCIHGIQVIYQVDDDVLLIKFASKQPLNEQLQKNTIRMIGNYLIAEGFVKKPVDESV